MKRIIYSLIIVAFISCKGNENKQQTGTASDTTKTNAAATEYTCPMHPEVTSDKPGQCPQCGMDLQAKS
jgi:membrane fusion protein, copper/silver efflux system